MRGGGGADLDAGAVGADEVGELGLQLAVAADEGVIFGVGNLRRVVGVIEAVVVRDLGGETLQLGGGFGFGHARARFLELENLLHAAGPGAAGGAGVVADARSRRRRGS